MTANSKQIAELLTKRMMEVAEGKNLAGADSLCRLVETYIKLATLEIQYGNAKTSNPKLDVPMLK